MRALGLFSLYVTIIHHVVAFVKLRVVLSSSLNCMGCSLTKNFLGVNRANGVCNYKLCGLAILGCLDV